MCKSPFKSLVDDVHEDRIKDIWEKNPDLIPVSEARKSNDPIITEFVEELDDEWKIIDLRNPEIGSGFSWGRCEEFTRHADEMIFALKPKTPGMVCSTIWSEADISREQATGRHPYECGQPERCVNRTI